MKFLDVIEKHRFVSFLLFTVFIIACIFYWFEFRPNYARKFCEHEAQEGWRMSEAFRESLYKNCLREQYGLEK